MMVRSLATCALGAVLLVLDPIVSFDQGSVLSKALRISESADVSKTTDGTRSQSLKIQQAR